VVFENGNNLRVQAIEHLGEAESATTCRIPGFMEAYLRPLFARGIGPFRWVVPVRRRRRARPGRPGDSPAELSPAPRSRAGSSWPARHDPRPGAARALVLAGPRASAPRSRSRPTTLVADGRWISAPVLFSRDHLDSAGMTHPRIGTEAMRDGSDGVTDWPLLDAMALAASGGADLVAIHSGGRWVRGLDAVAGVSVVADGPRPTAVRLRRALDGDTGLGVMRHASAGYETAPASPPKTPRPCGSRGCTRSPSLRHLAHRSRASHASLSPTPRTTPIRFLGEHLMRDLTSDDARRGVIGGGVFACGGGGWQHHGELMGHIATSMGVPQLASVDELPEDAWVATVTAIGAPASPTWEIRPVDYVHALQALMEHSEHPIAAVMTAQNGYSTTHNGWIQSAVLGVKVLDAAGDVRAHPTGKLGSLGLTTRPGYVSTQVVSGGNRALHGHFLSVNRGTVSTCDDVLRDISVRTGGFIASARNVVELSWVKGARGAGLDLAGPGPRRRHGTSGRRRPRTRRGRGRSRDPAAGRDDPRPGPTAPRGPLETRGGWDRGTFRIGDHTVPYLNEYMAIDRGTERVATYPDTIVILDKATGEGLAVKDAARGGQDVALLVSPAGRLPVSGSSIDRAGLAECEAIMGIDFLTPSQSRPAPRHRPLHPRPMSDTLPDVRAVPSPGRHGSPRPRHRGRRRRRYPALPRPPGDHLGPRCVRAPLPHDRRRHERPPARRRDRRGADHHRRRRCRHRSRVGARRPDADPGSARRRPGCRGRHRAVRRPRLRGQPGGWGHCATTRSPPS
jgi:DUF917 family protein